MYSHRCYALRQQSALDESQRQKKNALMKKDKLAEKSMFQKAVQTMDDSREKKERLALKI